ncbi:MBL fold metallo-hydrolase [Allostreptomyces psammosilenae]|uniref:L-ascorbate metabolism protein UlaG (Beta-lactamase superfamily) n=1 Tax=Allostreptomyces psammosilenae TaxID=1892865 RepID=A0A852ZYX2_9ACTN|nr:MBL fold metallo-hydrolase [Allostreptomyces psammosilenae]NYI03308.1 L-ascorbate metabolism protein UlaG (beta-lactamase superfamily) [Allostreptomyces psammosilenae]
MRRVDSDPLRRPSGGRPIPPMRFLGHSTVLVEIGGCRVLTDPVLVSRVIALRRVGAPVEAVHHAGVDLVVISHLHADHLHLPSLRLLGRAVPVVVPAGAGPWLRRKGFTHVTELAPGESLRRGGLTLTATEAVHDGARRPAVRGIRAVAVGYLMRSTEHHVYFAGDTDLFDGMADLADLAGRAATISAGGPRDVAPPPRNAPAEQDAPAPQTAPPPGGDGGPATPRHQDRAAAPRPRLDVALLPVWGWGPNLGPGHLDPARAAEAVRRIAPAFAVPIHWGTLSPYGAGRWMRHLLVDPPHRFAAEVAAAGLDTEVLITPPGGVVGVAGADHARPYRGPAGGDAPDGRIGRRPGRPATAPSPGTRAPRRPGEQPR